MSTYLRLNYSLFIIAVQIFPKYGVFYIYVSQRKSRGFFFITNYLALYHYSFLSISIRLLNSFIFNSLPLSEKIFKSTFQSMIALLYKGKKRFWIWIFKKIFKTNCNLFTTFLFILYGLDYSMYQSLNMFICTSSWYINIRWMIALVFTDFRTSNLRNS